MVKRLDWRGQIFALVLMAVGTGAGAMEKESAPVAGLERSAQVISPPSAEQKSKIDRKLKKAAQQPPQGFPDQAEAFYVNSRTGPIITRGDNPTEAIRSIGPDMYFEALGHIRSMPRISSDTGRVSLAEGASGPFDPFAATPGNALGAWSNLGPANQGGRTRALIIHPTNTSTMYAGGVAGGVWKTTDAGLTWSTNTDQMANLAVVALAFDPLNPDVIYAGTGEGFGNFDAIRGAGIFKSTDAGASWSQIPATNNANFNFTMKIIVSPRNTQRIWAATGQGVFRSIDGGASFSEVLNASAVGGCNDMAIQKSGASGRVFAACGRTNLQGTIYRADDTDASTLASIMSLTGQGRSSLAIAPSNEAVLYVMSSQRSAVGGPGQYGLHGIYRSIDNGDNFTTQRLGTSAFAGTTDKIQKALLSNPVFALLTECGFGSTQQLNQGWYDNVIAVDPVNENRIWAGGIDLWRSDNGGVDWGVASYWWSPKTNPEYAHADQHGIVFPPDYNGTSNRVMFVANDGGIQRTADATANVGSALAAVCGTPVAGAVSWSDRSAGMVTTQFYDGAVYPDGLTYFGGLQDNGTLRGFSGNLNWSILAGGDGGYAAVDTNAAPTNDDVLFLENTGNSLKRSTDGGATFNAANGGIAGSGFLFIAPFTMANANKDEIWTGGFDIWRSINQATSWARATGTNSTCGAGSISAIAVHPADGNRVLIGMSDGCFHYNYSALTAPNTGLWPGGGSILAGGYISWMAWHPTDPLIAYATVSSFGANNLFRSVDGGQTWLARVGAGATALPQIPALSVAINPNFPDQVFVGTDLGVFTSIDAGATWYVENTGFAKTPVESLKFDSGGNNLFAFTHGRGAWKTRVCNNCDLFTIGGTVSGLAAGNDVVLRNNGLDDLVVAANGSFTFPEPLQDLSTYSVSVRTQPTTPDQICTVTNGSGTLAGANVTNVVVNCALATFTVGGTVSGLAAGNAVVLRNNGGDDVTVSTNGGFTFPTSLTNGAAYLATVFTQPTTPNQTCLVTAGSGNVTSANVTNIQVTCTTITHTIGGTVSGLAAGNSVVLQNNGGDNLIVNADGGFTFATPLADGSFFSVTVLTQPTTPNQTCAVAVSSGQIVGANITAVTVTCTTDTYTIGGTISGLAVGATATLLNNGGNSLVVGANGPFTFSTALNDGSTYSVTVGTQPDAAFQQQCLIASAEGTLVGANIGSVAVTCLPNGIFTDGFE